MEGELIIRKYIFIIYLLKFEVHKNMVIWINAGKLFAKIQNIHDKRKQISWTCLRVVSRPTANMTLNANVENTIV